MSEGEYSSPSEIEAEVRKAIRPGITFTSANIFNENLVLQDVIGIIAAFNRDEAIALCAEWNNWNTGIMFRNGDWANAEVDKWRLLAMLVPPGAQMRAIEVFNDENFIAPFSEISVISLIGLLCRYGAKIADEKMKSRRNQQSLFRALLALQGAIFPENFFALTMEEQFPFMVRITLANLSIQNRWTYDMGRLHVLLTVPEIASRLNGITMRQWFQKRLNIDGNDYEWISNVILGGAHMRADYSKLQEQAPALYERMSGLLELSTTTPERVTLGLNPDQPQPDPSNLCDASSYSSVLLVRPMLKVGKKLVSTSSRNLFNKAHRGLRSDYSENPGIITKMVEKAEISSTKRLNEIIEQMKMGETVTLYRPVGPKELELIRASGNKAFPPRLPEQPISELRIVDFRLRIMHYGFGGDE